MKTISKITNTITALTSKVFLIAVLFLAMTSIHAQSENQKTNTFFWTVAEVELRMPVWRFYKTKAYKNYIGALDSFTE